MPGQGTNAHVAVEVIPDTLDIPLFQNPEQPWSRTQHLYAPSPHPLLRVAAVTRQGYATADVLLQGAPYSRPGAGYLKEVLLSGQAVLPPAAGLEVRYYVVMLSIRGLEMLLQSQAVLPPAAGLVVRHCVLHI